MDIQIFENYTTLCEKVAESIITIINQKPDALICLGSGDTPLGVFEILIKKAKNFEVDFSKTQFVGLDEWLGMDETDEGSCFNIMYQKLFIPLKIPKNHIHCFNAKSIDLELECKKIDNLIDNSNGLDLALLGVGTNGHLAMNEPNTPFDSTCYISKLADTTIITGQKYFKSETPLSLGITIGLKQIIESKSIILMANGSKKAEIIAKTINAVPDIELPSSILHLSEKAIIMVDKDAASLID